MEPEQPVSRSALAPFVVTAEQMRQIEERVFDAGMPVAALMEKVANLIHQIVCQRLDTWRIDAASSSCGVLAGPGHNGGDALVVARELHLRGYSVCIHQPLEKAKALTASHARYARSLGIPFVALEALGDCDLIIDGLFGFGLTRPLEGNLAKTVDTINGWSSPVISIDLPSGIHTDTGAVLGTAIRARETLCLGLWKRACVQEAALPYLGHLTLIDFDLPIDDIQAVLGQNPSVHRLTSALALECLPLPRSQVTHKYKVGQLLVVAGSHTYAGAAILTALGARASGVGMLTVAVPQSLKPLIHTQLPEALVVSCEETDSGAIAALPDDLDFSKYTAIACGPGLTRADAIVAAMLAAPVPLVLDADGLNTLAELGVELLEQRQDETIITPHPGEFRRLFPDIWSQSQDAGVAAEAAAQQTGAVVIFKGARSAIATPQSQLWYLADSTPALARGGSGDILAGLVAGLLAQNTGPHPALAAALGGVWWHAQGALLAASERTVLGVDPVTLASYLPHVLQIQATAP